jgi:hypothetical protein
MENAKVKNLTLGPSPKEREARLLFPYISTAVHFSYDLQLTSTILGNPTSALFRTQALPLPGSSKCKAKRKKTFQQKETFQRLISALTMYTNCSNTILAEYSASSILE